MDDRQIDKYLFNEMPETERENFEDTIAVDDALFYEVAERENELVDQYTTGRLAGDALQRFEKSLESLPARRQKVENAKILHQFVVEQRADSKTITIAERSGFFSRLFSFDPALQLASVAAIVLLAIVSVFLFAENRRLGSLEQELAASRQRESDLVAQSANERDVSGDLTADLEAERERAARLEAEIAKLRNNSPVPPINRPPLTIATLVLSSAGIRGDAIPIRRFDLPEGVERVSIVIGIASDAQFTEPVSIVLNGERIAEDAKVRIRLGEKSVAVTVPAAKLKQGRNELLVNDSKNTIVARYVVAR